ncbi:SMC family ATPase [Roseofilum casamattae]|uniref:Nuclease SbcCD subunit C n=1 Tax=Roseofilum casamattae BLCC-M143 TaxID=3022442 RepID=A0ABT7BXR5_9CYAN|nr:SMC family ATPase [Roseofilum casamattae]MDJ1183987.1 SMC family ATPase [Roseofilum casamattae BLCC-M143]
MEILSVNLKNFKSHQDIFLEFESGSNAICGENGAGKTSILEAVAWVLFNYCQYQRDELIRKGAKSAQAIIQFISNRDGRTYQVKRCTRKGYELYDPQIGCKLDPTKVSDVVLWLQEHIGVPKDTDLADLFSQVIGIPQGTFTQDFLAKEAARKQVFDPILRVEDYKKAYKESNELQKFSLAEVTACEQHLERYDIQLQDWEELKQRHETLTANIEQGESEQTAISSKLKVCEQRQQELSSHQEKLDRLMNEIQTIETKLQGLVQDRYHLQTSCDRARESLKVCEENRDSYRNYQQAEQQLIELKIRQKTQQKLLRQREQLRQKLQESQGQLTKLEISRENARKAEAKIKQLSPLQAEQQTLEEQQRQLETELQQIRDWQWQQERTERQLYDALRWLQEFKQEATRLQGLETSVAQIPQLEQQYHRYQEQLSRVAAARQFSGQIATLVDRAEGHQDYYQQLQSFLPALDPKVQKLIESDHTCQQEMFEILQEIRSDLAAQVNLTDLENHCDRIKSQLETAYECRAQLSRLEIKCNEEIQVKQEAENLRSHLMELEDKLDGEERLKEERQTLCDRLQTLQNPKQQIQLLQQQLAEQGRLEEQWQEIEQTQHQLQSELADLETQLAEFAHLETELDAREKIKQDNATEHLAYLRAEPEANTLETRQNNLQKAIATLEQLEGEKAKAVAERNALSTAYSADRFAQLQQESQTLTNRFAQLETMLALYREQLTEICQSLVKKGEISQQRENTLVELAKAQKHHQFIQDARNFFNRASPRITKYYLGEISHEADSIFRELMNRQNVALEWTEDYDILVQEDGYKRNFKSLSGGEQMCAALAVRLALLRTLADLDIAFFDEPTTNMDRPRRQQLAEAIGNLKSFRQLFVISHDDTFENMSNLIHIQRS